MTPATLSMRQRSRSDGREEPLLAVDDLVLDLRSAAGRSVRVLDHVSFEVGRNHRFGIIGESGAGKSLTAMSVLRLLPRQGATLSGSIRFSGRELSDLGESELREVRGRQIGMIFQDPMKSLNPAFRIGDQIAETLRAHGLAGRRASWRQAIDLLKDVEIPDAKNRALAYPHEFSGGMRQRAMVAMALACGPELLIADEPTTALDVTVEARILELLRRLQKERSLSVILITHDFGLVQDFCQDAMVMYAGQVVEAAPTEALFERPRHPYTYGLIRSMPGGNLGSTRTNKRRLWSMPGRAPTAGEWPVGCRFHPRCAFSEPGRCDAADVELANFQGRSSRCLRVEEIGSEIDVGVRGIR